jgi:hypothetical protein
MECKHNKILEILHEVLEDAKLSDLEMNYIDSEMFVQLHDEKDYCNCKKEN